MMIYLLLLFAQIKIVYNLKNINDNIIFQKYLYLPIVKNKYPAVEFVCSSQWDQLYSLMLCPFPFANTVCSLLTPQL